MKRSVCRILPVLLGLAGAVLAQEDAVMKAMRDEMSRSMAQLRLENLDKPYFIAYRVDDTGSSTVSATLGQVTASNSDRTRGLTLQVRVGDYQLDNTNFVSGGRASGIASRALPLDDDYDQIRREIWLATDAEYKQAGAALAAKRSALEHRKTTASLPDFTRQSAVTVDEPAAAPKIELPALEKLARDLSGVFRDTPEILNSSLQITVSTTLSRYVNSEGTSFTRTQPMLFLNIAARILCADGAPLEDSFQVYGRSADVLRTEELLARSRDLLARLKALSAAPALDRYSGPVLFEDEAAGQAIEQVLAPALVALRIPMTDDPRFEGQFQQILDQFGFSLADRVGGRVMPDAFDVTDNPRTGTLAGAPLLGACSIDHEGVPCQEAKLVEGGTLQALLATRTPTAQTKTSTGSNRTFGGAVPSNLFVTTRKPVSGAELRRELLRVAKQRGYGYGIIVRRVGAGNLNALMRLGMSRMSANTGSTIAAYKLFDDGHEELVRADIAPIPVAAFKDILAAGDKPRVHDGLSVPLAGMLMGGPPNPATASFIVPSLLFEEVSLKRPEGPSPVPPVVPSPLAGRAK